MEEPRIEFLCRYPIKVIGDSEENAVTDHNGGSRACS